MTLLFLLACEPAVEESIEEATEVAESERGGHWKRLDAMAFGHVDYTATAYKDGSVLLVGGFSDKTELYDSTRKRFRTVSPTPDSRMDHAAVLLADGSVLVAGGRVSVDGGARQVDASTLLYNRAEDSWTAGPSMTLARAEHTLSLVGDRVWACGGGDESRLIAPCEVFDGSSWALSDELEAPRRDHTATVSGGQLFILGGTDDEGVVGKVDVIGGDSPGPLRLARAHHHAFEHQGEVWVVGGWDGTDVTGSVEILKDGEWTEGVALHHPRALHGGGSLSDGRVVIFGGTPIVDSPDVLALREVELFEEGAWVYGARLVKGRYGAPTLTTDEGLVFAGGDSRGKAVMDITRYSPGEKPPREDSPEDLPSLGAEDAPPPSPEGPPPPPMSMEPPDAHR
jgi:hypothetical protein